MRQPARDNLESIISHLLPPAELRRVHRDEKAFDSTLFGMLYKLLGNLAVLIHVAARDDSVVLYNAT